jgi:hypothetical protein
MTGLGKLLSFSLPLILLTACGLTASAPTPEPVLGMETALAIAAATAKIPRPTPTPAALGTLENPLIVALPPGSSTDEVRVEAGKAFAEQLSEVTGFNFVVVAPESYAKLVDAMGKGNAHVAVLSPYAYALAYEKVSSHILMRKPEKILPMRLRLSPSSTIKSPVGPMKFHFRALPSRPGSWHTMIFHFVLPRLCRDNPQSCGVYTQAEFVILAPRISTRVPSRLYWINTRMCWNKWM